LRLRRLQGRVTYDSETDTEGQSQVFSSQSENESGASQTTRGSRRRRQAKTDGAINLSETVVICYLGALLLRVPCTVADLITRVDDGALLYYRAGREVPGNLKERLPGEFQVLLEPQAVLKAAGLHRKILELGTLLSAEFGMVLPAINHPLLLHRWMQDLALPIEVYAATQRLARLLGVDFTLHVEGKTSSKRVLRYPEVRLMALLVVSTKLFFPIDDVDRHPLSASDLSVLQMDWPAWVASHSSRKNILQDESDSNGNDDNKTETARSMTFPEGSRMSESDCLAMGDAELDCYLDWYEANLANESVREHGRAGRDADFRRTLMRMFPTQSSSRPTAVAASASALASVGEGEGRGGGEGEDRGRDTNLAATTTTQRLRQVQQTLQLKKIVVSGRENEDEDEEGNSLARVGSFYRRHREAKELEGPAKLLYTKAAELAGVSLKGITTAVFATERKLQMREERARSTGDGDDDDDD
jgi:RNA polymerase I-specific transcription initiation factor RRN7